MNITGTLENLIRTIPAQLTLIAEDEFNKKANPVKWSKKEILGHMCDSAVNNHQRFIKAILADQPITIEGYDQDQWAALHGYHTSYSHTELIALWTGLNKQILHVLSSAGDEHYNKTLILPDASTVTLKGLAEDYIHHTQHHLNQIIEIPYTGAM